MNFAIWLIKNKLKKIWVGRSIDYMQLVLFLIKVNMIIKLPKKYNIHQAEARCMKIVL